MAGWVTILGSAAIVITVFDLIANLRSIDTRERVQRVLSEPPLKGTGFDVQQVLTVMHVLALVAAGCATAAAILGVHVLRRNRTARLGLTVLAVPLFVAGLVTGGFMSSMVAVAVIMLWTRPARDWFDGRAPQRTATQPEPPAPEPPAPPPQDRGPAAYAGFGTPAATPTDQAAPQQGQQQGQQGQQGQQQGPPTGPVPPQQWPDAQLQAAQQEWARQQWLQQQPPLPTTGARPRELVQACLLTWVFSAIVVAAMALVLVAFAADPSIIDEVYSSDDRFADSGLNPDQLRVWSMGLAAVFGAWGLGAIGLAVLTYVGRAWARWTLLFSAAAATLLSLLMAIASPVLFLFTIPCAAGALLLTRPAVSAWFARRTPPAS
jgi:hypothetical protein